MIGIYLRVSTEKQDESMQLSAIKRIITEEEYSNAKVYRDIGITGTTAERPDYQKLLSDVTSGKIEKIVCYEYSRLWRDMQEQSRVLKILKALNIPLQSVTEGYTTTEEDVFKANILGSSNAYFIAQLKRRIKDGIERKKQKIKDGKCVWNGRGKDKKVRKRPKRKDTV